jgi:uncharacterized protein YhbP (UPF0306 family)
MLVTKTKLQRYLRENDLMALATCSGGKPWSCSLLFVNDDDFNFYVYSGRNTQHSRDIVRNQNVAFSINHEISRGDFEGLQFSGMVKDVKLREAPKIAQSFIKKYSYSKGWFSREKIKLLFSKAGKSRLYKIITDRIYYLEKGNFSERLPFRYKKR